MNWKHKVRTITESTIDLQMVFSIELSKIHDDAEVVFVIEASTYDYLTWWRSRIEVSKNVHDTFSRDFMRLKKSCGFGSCFLHGLDGTGLRFTRTQQGDFLDSGKQIKRSVITTPWLKLNRIKLLKGEMELFAEWILKFYGKNFRSQSKGVSMHNSKGPDVSD